MRKSKKGLVVAMALSLLAGVGFVVADAVGGITRTPANTGVTYTTDSACVLKWGSALTSDDNIAELKTLEPEYLYFSVAPESSKSYTGTIEVTITLAAGQNKVLTGVTLDVIHAAEAVTDASFDTLTVDQLGGTKLSGTYSFTVATSAATHTTTEYFGLKLEYDGTCMEGSIGGTVAITAGFAAPVQG